MAIEDGTEQIVNVLRRDGRASFSDIARELDLDRNLVARRVTELLATGELKILASVHPEIFGLKVYAHLAIRMIGPTTEILEYLAQTDPAILVTETTGQNQVVVDLLLTDASELNLHVQSIRSRPGVVSIAVDLYQDVLTSFFRGTHPGRVTGLDQEDIRVIRILRSDGRASFTQIADSLGISISTARARVQRLVAQHVIQIGGIRQRSRMTRDLLFGIGICVTDPHDLLIEFLESSPNLEFLATSSGRFDLIATVGSASLHELNEFMATLRATAGFVSAEQWLHTRIVQERYDRALGFLNPQTTVSLSEDS